MSTPDTEADVAERLDETAIDKLVILFGYAAEPILIRTWLEQEIGGALVSLIYGRLETLATIDDLLLAELGKPVISEVSGIVMSPGGKVRQLKAEGSRIVNELAAMFGIRVLHNKYGSGSLSIRSY